MNNHLLLVAAVVSTALGSWSAPLTPEEALARVGTTATESTRVVSNGKVELRFTKTFENTPAVYVFAKGADEGYLVVSADDSTTPLLGYSDSGTLPATEEELPDGMRYWLESLAEQIKYNSSNATDRKTLRVTKTRNDIAPLIKTKWNQSEPYNNLCPLVGNNRCVTGCVATAMAQVLKFYEWPEKGIGTHSYYWNGQQLKFDYANTTFDWSNMTDTYGSSSSAVENTAVATLMSACGISVDMSYRVNSSGAISRNMGTALINNFGYDKGLRYLSRDYYTIDQWEDLVYDNLINYGPVLYDGRNSSSGHQFICDGYQNGYFHFNWGWAGLSDGYYLLTALDPGSQGIGGSTAGYNLNQDILTHLSHDGSNPDYYLQMGLDGDFTLSPTEVNLGSRVSAVLSIYNYSYADIINLQVGIMIVPSDGDTPYFIEGFSYPYELPSGYGFSNVDFYVTVPGGLEEGTYTIVPAFRIGNDGEPHAADIPINKIGKYTMTVADGKATFAAFEPATVTCENLSLESDLYIGSDFKLKFMLKNNSEETDYQGNITAGLLKNGSIVAVGDALSIVLTPGQSREQQYLSGLNATSGTLSAGSYQLVMLQEETDSYSAISDPIDVTLHAATSYSISISDLTIESGQIRDNMTATATLRCSSGYFAGTLKLYIFPYTSGSVQSVGSYDSEFVSVSATGSAGSSAERATAVGSVPVTWKFSFDNGTPGGQYFANVYNNNSWIANQPVFTLSEKEFTLIEFTAEDNQVISREYITLTGVILKETVPVHGLYILRETYADGTVRTRRVAVN